MDIRQHPALTVTLDGRSLDAQAMVGLTGVTVRQRLSLPTQCELIFAVAPEVRSSLTAFAVGSALRLTLQDEPQPLFAGQVTALQHVYAPDGGHELRVRGYDALHVLRKRQAVRVHVQLTTRELARELTASEGLTVESAESGLLIDRLLQHAQTDFDLLAEQAARAGLYFFVRDGVLHLFTLAGIGPTVPLTLGATLLEANFERNSDQIGDSVTATGWSALSAESFRSAQRTPRSGRQVSAELNGSAVGAGDSRWLVAESAVDEDHAQALAQADLDRRTATTLTAWGVAAGTPSLTPGSIVALDGVDASIAGRYVLTQVTHTVSGTHGYLTEFSSAPPPARRRSTAALMGLGIVADVADPDGQGRVRVDLPAYEDVESSWLHVIAPAAGPNKGLVMLPDVGDRVLVLFTHGEPDQGVVVGGFYRPNPPYDTGVENGAVRRYALRTPDGHTLRFDDAAQAIRLEDSHGSYIEMTPGKVKLFANTDLEIAAPGRSIVISGQAIDFQRS